MAASTTRDKILDAVRQLPPDATVEDAIERLVILAKIERGSPGRRRPADSP